MTSVRIPARAFAAILVLAAAAPVQSQTAAPYSEAVRIVLTSYTQDYPWAAQDTRLLVAGDFNADGAADVAMSTPGRWYTFTVDPGWAFTPHIFQPGGQSTGIAAADFNGDGKGDLAVGLADTVAVNYGDGSGGFTGGPQLAMGSIGPNSRITDIAAADFDRDGKIDLAVVDTDPLNDSRTHPGGNPPIYHRNSVALMRGTSGGNFVADPVRPRLLAPEFPLRTRSEDFNGDGRPELLLENHNTVKLLFNGSNGGFAAANLDIFPGGLPPQVDVIGSAAGDFNGDGRRDLAALASFPPANALGGFYRVNFYRNAPDPNRPFALVADVNEIALPHAATSIAVIDFNGDGRSDVVVGLEAAGAKSLALYAGRGDFSFDPPLYFNGGFDAGAIAVGDFNGDTKPDIAVVDCAGAFVVLRHD
jgi:hypothetical protein